MAAHLQRLSGLSLTLLENSLPAGSRSHYGHQRFMLWMESMVIVLMGVAGSGKTTVGETLARRLGWQFYDADDFHPPRNREKMRRGIPLVDNDRRPWLDAIRTFDRPISGIQAKRHLCLLRTQAVISRLAGG